jgi:hypothetical protein
MNVLLFSAIIFLVIINLLALMFTGLTFLETYNIRDSFGYAFALSMLVGLEVITNAVLVVTLNESNQNGLSFLIQIGILITCILLITLFDNVDYKRNVKPYLRIKI